MRETLKLGRYQLRDLMRSKWLFAYSGFFFLVTFALFRFVGDGSKVAVSLMNLVLFIIPLVSTMLGTTYYYGSREFVELMLAQPIKRGSLFAGLCLGVSIPLVLSFLAGVGGAFLFCGSEVAQDLPAFLTLLVVGAVLTFIFVALAFLVAVTNKDKARGLGISLLFWLVFSVIYDGLVLLAVVCFADYPLEMPLLILSILNPIDLARVLILLKFDVSALMGYTGAVFQQFFGSSWGIAIALTSLVGWSVLTFILGRSCFARKDF
ncbi:ABC transporter permease subunit [Geomesophilobacter sediminis]|uniref:ABC transporter permease subunit n=1 Tax=Geomesophilobacter sediminis TaxID=2798584 RepID=A0A8J7M088_9BACT|nr:ABC transporter permease subunit [Geomesophilobacter sediminis]MBJ6723912.1 ABC transporter permease subunit [Geomesophilobacter sediminis]